MKRFLYILIFKNQSFLKIGKASGKFRRIEQLQHALSNSCEIDLNRSYVITAKRNSDINLLESTLLRITENDKFYLPFLDNVKGREEFRNIECLSKVLKYIDIQNNYIPNLKLYHGIDICGNYNHTIPKSYFPSHIRSNGLSKELIDDLDIYCKKNNVNWDNMINELLYQKAKELNIDRKDTIKLTKNMFKV